MCDEHRLISLPASGKDTAMVSSALKNFDVMPADEIDEANLVTIKGPTKTAERNSSEDVAAYISQMVGEMAVMARSAHLDLLAYFLEMARIEANGNAGKLNETH